MSNHINDYGSSPRRSPARAVGSQISAIEVRWEGMGPLSDVEELGSMRGRDVAEQTRRSQAASSPVPIYDSNTFSLACKLPSPVRTSAAPFTPRSPVPTSTRSTSIKSKPSNVKNPHIKPIQTPSCTQISNNLHPAIKSTSGSHLSTNNYPDPQTDEDQKPALTITPPTARTLAFTDLPPAFSSTSLGRSTSKSRLGASPASGRSPGREDEGEPEWESKGWMGSYGYERDLEKGRVRNGGEEDGRGISHSPHFKDRPSSSPSPEQELDPYNRIPHKFHVPRGRLQAEAEAQAEIQANMKQAAGSSPNSHANNTQKKTSSPRKSPTSNSSYAPLVRQVRSQPGGGLSASTSAGSHLASGPGTSPGMRATTSIRAIRANSMSTILGGVGHGNNTTNSYQSSPRYSSRSSNSISGSSLSGRIASRSSGGGGFASGVLDFGASSGGAISNVVESGTSSRRKASKSATSSVMTGSQIEPAGTSQIKGSTNEVITPPTDLDIVAQDDYACSGLGEDYEQEHDEDTYDGSPEEQDVKDSQATPREIRIEGYEQKHDAQARTTSLPYGPIDSAREQGRSREGSIQLLPGIGSFIGIATTPGISPLVLPTSVVADESTTKATPTTRPRAISSVKAKYSPRSGQWRYASNGSTASSTTSSSSDSLERQAQPPMTLQDYSLLGAQRSFMDGNASDVTSSSQDSTPVKRSKPVSPPGTPTPSRLRGSLAQQQRVKQQHAALGLGSPVKPQARVQGHMQSKSTPSLGMSESTSEQQLYREETGYDSPDLTPAKRCVGGVQRSERLGEMEDPNAIGQRYSSMMRYRHPTLQPSISSVEPFNVGSIGRPGRSMSLMQVEDRDGAAYGYNHLHWPKGNLQHRPGSFDRTMQMQLNLAQLSSRNNKLSASTDEKPRAVSDNPSGNDPSRLTTDFSEFMQKSRIVSDPFPVGGADGSLKKKRRAKRRNFELPPAEDLVLNWKMLEWKYGGKVANDTLTGLQDAMVYSELTKPLDVRPGVASQPFHTIWHSSAPALNSGSDNSASNGRGNVPYDRSRQSSASSVPSDTVDRVDFASLNVLESTNSNGAPDRSGHADNHSYSYSDNSGNTYTAQDQERVDGRPFSHLLPSLQFQTTSIGTLGAARARRDPLREFDDIASLEASQSQTRRTVSAPYEMGRVGAALPVRGDIQGNQQQGLRRTEQGHEGGTGLGRWTWGPPMRS